MNRGNRLKIRILEEAGFAAQTFRLPTRKGADWQNRQVQRIYHAANIGRQIEGLPKKKYPLLDSKGKVILGEV